MQSIPSDTDWVKSDESFRATVYDDATGEPIRPGSVVKGHPTIAWGVKLDGAGLTSPEGQSLMDSRMSLARGQASQDLGIASWTVLNQPRRAALTNMAFAMGGGGLAQFDRMLTAIRASDWAAAKAECLDSEFGRNPKWEARARRVAEALSSGNWPAAA